MKNSSPKYTSGPSDLSNVEEIELLHVNGNYLALKYKAIKLTHELTEKQLIDVGWKCRKYQRWDQVHVSEGDNLKLRMFGDSAVDDLEFNFEVLGRVNEILLNVARWRLDKEELSIEPPKNEAWDHAFNILKATIDSPKLGYLYLAEKLGSRRNSLQPVNVSEYLTKYLVASVIASRLNKKVTYPETESLDLDLDVLVESVTNNVEIPDELEEIFGIRDIFAVAGEIGLPSIEFVEYPNVSFDEVEEVFEELINYSELSSVDLLTYENTGSMFVTTVNKNNRFISAILENESNRTFNSMVWKAYASAADKMSVSDQKAIMRHQSYFAMALEEQLEKHDS